MWTVDCSSLSLSLSLSFSLFLFTRSLSFAPSAVHRTRHLLVLSFFSHLSLIRTVPLSLSLSFFSSCAYRSLSFFFSLCISLSVCPLSARCLNITRRGLQRSGPGSWADRPGCRHGDRCRNAIIRAHCTNSKEAIVMVALAVEFAVGLSAGLSGRESSSRLTVGWAVGLTVGLAVG